MAEAQIVPLVLPGTTQECDELPPTGIFPATIRCLGVANGRLTVEFHVEWKPGSVHRCVRQPKKDSVRGRRLVTHLRKITGLEESKELSDLDGKQISVKGEACVHNGRWTWIARKFLRLTESKTEDGVGVEPDVYDRLADQLLSKLPKARFVQNDDTASIILPGRAPIPIDTTSNDYTSLQHQHTGIGTIEQRGRVVAQRVLLKVLKRADSMQMVQFSHADEHRVLIPVEGGKVLRIHPEGFELVENGTEKVWVEHPRGKPYRWEPEADPSKGLEKFDELLVKTLAMPKQSMLAVLGVTLGVLPLVRHKAPTRPVVEASGQSGHGKTTGTRRFLKLHQLGDVQGDYSLAQAKRDGDVGLIIRDNVETINLNRSIEDFFLFGATGGDYARVGVGRITAYPVIGVTTVEGIGRRPETNRRLIRFDFQRGTSSLSESSILEEINKNRALIFRGLAEVMKCVLADQGAQPKVTPMPDFPEFCGLVHRTLRAFETIGVKPAGFADGVFEDWNKQQSGNVDDSAGQYPRLLEKLITRRDGPDAFHSLRESITETVDYNSGSNQGRVFVATPTAWLSALKEIASKEHDVSLPSTPEGLRRRLKALKPAHGFILLTENDDKDLLGRRGSRRSWGILEIASP